MKIFDKLAAKRPPKNKFDLTHEKKLSCNMGDLVPVYVQEIVPGDKFRVSSEVFMRLAPLVSPIMHRLNVSVHYFFVPNRLVWDSWEMFITRGRNGEQAPIAPHFKVDVAASLASNFLVKGSLFDFMGGKPVNDAGGDLSTQKINIIPFRAYQKVWDDYFRDPTLTPPLFSSDLAGGSHPIPITGGEVTDVNQLNQTLGIRKRAWEKDYFTSAQPNAQRGSEVQIPIEGLDINYKDIATAVDHITGTPVSGPVSASTASPGDLHVGSDIDPNRIRIENIDSIEGYGLTVNELRTTLALQKWFEKNARAGYRYIEQILSHFGVKSSDARLQRAEYLGGGKVPVKISEVLSTFGDADGTVSELGQMAGHGVSFGQTNRFDKSFEEHGFVIGVLSVLPRTNYQDGINRVLTQREVWDQYYWPEFAHLGEQPIVNSELYWNGNDPDTIPPNGTWGYQSRYCEYKYGISTVHGDFRDDLDFWHMGRKFSTLPSLNDTFVLANPTHRVFNVTDENVDKCYVHILNKVDAIRPMPYFGIPAI